MVLGLATSSLGDTGQFITGIATLLLALAGIFTLIATASSYRAQAGENRGRWLMELQKRFTSEEFRAIRRQLYNPDSDLVRALQHKHQVEDQKGAKPPMPFTDAERQLLVELDDYLDFFELIEHLIEGGKLDLADADHLFEWYVIQGLDAPAIAEEIIRSFEAVTSLRKRFKKFSAGERRSGAGITGPAEDWPAG